MAKKSNHKLRALKDELRSISSLNFIAKSSNFIEKIFWATIAICGTLFIYDAMKSQLESWNSNPILKTQETLELKDLPIPDITLCHKAMLKYGPAERLINFIEPEKDVPKEVLAIRNEFLKVQFEKVKDQFGSKDFCQWLFNLEKDQKEDNIILSKINNKEFETLQQDCKVNQ